MGSDLYEYAVIKKEGSTVQLIYQSAQQCGLAPEGSEGQAFWVTAFLDHEDAFKFDENYRYVPNCPLAALSRWTELPFDVYPAVTVANFDNTRFSTLCQSLTDYSSAGTSGETLSVEFRSAEAAICFMEEIRDRSEWAVEGKTLEVNRKLHEGPLNRYSLPNSVFSGMIADVTLDELRFELADVDGTWDTEAVYTVV
ncbi:MAG: hypothetical protein KVP17_001546, partial [Porospora cf. gigantea B]